FPSVLSGHRTHPSLSLHSYDDGGGGCSKINENAQLLGCRAFAIFYNQPKPTYTLAKSVPFAV
ncbi:MAG: hypothetical protein M5Z89_24020, partial [Olivibacter sp.]|nr:hypothetical protein [Olivibacter sp. UJ_SKK_5.1]